MSVNANVVEQLSEADAKKALFSILRGDEFSKHYLTYLNAYTIVFADKFNLGEVGFCIDPYLLKDIEFVDIHENHPNDRMYGYFNVSQKYLEESTLWHFINSVSQASNECNQKMVEQDEKLQK